MGFRMIKLDMVEKVEVLLGKIIMSFVSAFSVCACAWLFVLVEGQKALRRVRGGADFRHSQCWLRHFRTWWDPNLLLPSANIRAEERRSKAKQTQSFRLYHCI